MTTRPLLLSVNIDHVATLRQARRAPYPDPVEAAAVAEDAGAHGITVHLRVDRRHIQDDDVRRLRPRVRGKLNLEISTAEEMLALAVETRPDQVTLVPERPEEVTTEGGLDVVKHTDTIRAAAERLASAGIDVSLFLDADPHQLDALAALDREAVPGFEINTDAYTKAVLGGASDAPRAELDKILRVAADGESAGLRVYAGHGLTTANVGTIAAVPQIEELNIGHWLVSRAAIVGLAASVQEMLAAMSAGRGDG
ncbi:MAG: pyridoxine 5'-phosphate synthase [Acidobacteriota bacterium]